MPTNPFRSLRILAFLALLAGLAAGGLLLGLPQGERALAKDKLADGALVADPAKLAAEGELKDIWLGNPKAPNTIYEYSSLTCGHCAQFHRTTLPELQKKYIDTGKVRYALREFPLDNLAVIGFMLARCDESKYTAIVEDLYKHQEDWAFVQGPFEKLKERAKALGFDDGKFMTCVRDQVQLDKIVKVHDLARKEFDVSSTPTLFVNGHIVRGPRDIADIEKYLTGLDK